MINLDKKKDIIELIRWYALQPSQLESVIPGYVNVALQAKERKDDPESIINAVREKVKTEAFIEQFVPSFDKKFTHEEIKYLLDFYKSDVMKKIMAEENVFMPIFAGFNTVILEIIEKKPC